MPWERPASRKAREIKNVEFANSFFNSVDFALGGKKDIRIWSFECGEYREIMAVWKTYG